MIFNTHADNMPSVSVFERVFRNLHDYPEVESEWLGGVTNVYNIYFNFVRSSKNKVYNS